MASSNFCDDCLVTFTLASILTDSTQIAGSKNFQLRLGCEYIFHLLQPRDAQKPPSLLRGAFVGY